MAATRPQFFGPRLRRLRRDRGLTQAQMAEDLGISPSYVALIERNQRPLSAALLLRLAETYGLDLAQLAGDGGAELGRQLEVMIRDPLFADLDLASGDARDLPLESPAMAEAMARLFSAYRESQLALADRQQAGAVSPLEETRAFLSARSNFFPVLDEQAERLSAAVEAAGGFSAYYQERHGAGIRRLPADVMNGAVRRYDPHRRELVLDERLGPPATAFQCALQLVYLELAAAVDAALGEGAFESEAGRALCRRALANYGAGAIQLPYTAFLKEAVARGYDIEALARRFGTSFEQTAHRLTTLQKPGAKGIPFFFIRVDAAGNVSKRLDSGSLPFARHGGSCPLWSLHDVFTRPDEVVVEVVELSDESRYFSIAKAVTAGGGAFGAARVRRAVALACAVEEAGPLVYASGMDLGSGPATPIGVACRLCQRPDCAARSEPPLGRTLLVDDYRRMGAPFGFADG